MKPGPALILLLGTWLGAASAGEDPWPPPLSWAKLPTKGSSGLTYESACAWDPRSGRLVMFGGHGSAYAGAERNDTWLFDPGTLSWLQAGPADRPPGACCTRDLVFDEAQGVTVYFGGCMYFHGWQWKGGRIRGGAPPWIYDAVEETWIPMKPSGAAPARVAYAGMAYDRDDQVVVKFGGGGCKVDDEGSTWVYDGFANTWTEMNPRSSPKSGRLPAMTYDEKHHVTLLFGANDGKSNDLWAYDIRKDAWTNRRAADPPPAGEMGNVNWGGPVDYGIFVYDRRTEAPVLFRPQAGLMGTRSYDWERNSWRKLKTIHPPPGAALTQGAYLPDRGITLLVNGGTPDGRNYLNGTWAFAHEAPPAPELMEPPTDLAVTSTRSQADLTWKAGASAEAGRYAVYRGMGARPWEVTYEKIAETDATSFSDVHVKRRGTAFYMVRAVGAMGAESRDSIKVRTQPRAPREPRAGVLPGNRIEIEWDAGPEPDIAGYNVYRGRGRPGAVGGILSDGKAEGFARVNHSLVEGTSFVDETASPEGLAYLVRAVNQRGIESGPSPWTLTIPPEVTGISVRAEGGSVALTWRPARGKGIRGYNVYRLDAAHAETATKLNTEPVPEPRYVDLSKKDTSPCRYYVVAVDARGVEGIASFGAWAFDNGRE